MLDAAAAGKLKALYVVGANPFRTFGIAARPAGLELLVVHELFLTETSREADILLPAACAYEKSGTVTNTAGEVQLLRKAADPPGVRTDFDILRILAHQLEKKGLGTALHARNPEAVFEEIRGNVPGYNVDLASLLSGGAVLAPAAGAKNGRAAFDVPDGAIRSAQDSLFSSGTLGRFCMMIESLAEAEKET
jgi:NADH-quinone oxidoreductase subunit G